MSKNSHHRKMYFFFLSFLLASFFIPSLVARADAGPHSSMHFDFQFPNNTVSIVSGKLIACPDKDCNSFVIYNDFGCDAKSCYGYPEEDYSNDNYLKMTITFTDGVRESNIFPMSKYYSSEYLVTFDQNRLIVKEVFTLSSVFNPFYLILFIVSVFITLPIETAIAFIYFWIIKVKQSFLLMVVFANLLSLSVIWFIFPIFFSGNSLFVVIAETFAVIFEAAFLFVTGREFRFSLAHASILSLIMNLASYSFGYWLLSRMLS